MKKSLLIFIAITLFIFLIGGIQKIKQKPDSSVLTELYSDNALISRLDHRRTIISLENSFLEKKEQDIDKAISYLYEMEMYIRTNITNAEDKAQYLMWVGQKYYSVERTQKAVSFFKEVRGMQDIGDFWRVDAMRMIAQVGLLHHNNADEAAIIYSEIIDIINRTEDRMILAGWQKVHLEDAYGKGAMAYDRLGNYELSIELRDKNLQDKRVDLTGEQRAWIGIEKARTLVKAKKHEEAVAAYETVFFEHPSFGYDDGSIVNFKRAAIEARDLPFDSPEFTQLIQELWDDPTLSDFRQILAIGQQLAYRYSGEGKQVEMFKIRNELLSKLEHFYEKDNTSLITREVYVENLMTLITEHLKLSNSATARDLCADFLLLFPDSDLVPNIQSLMKKLDSKNAVK